MARQTVVALTKFGKSHRLPFVRSSALRIWTSKVTLNCRGSVFAKRRMFSIPQRSGSRDSKRPIGICNRYSGVRPFSGRSFSERRHSWCEEWWDSSTNELVCSEGGENGSRSCAKGVSLKRDRKNALYCSKWSSAMTCNEPVDTLSTVRGSLTLNGYAKMPKRRALDSERTAVAGMYCRGDR